MIGTVTDEALIELAQAHGYRPRRGVVRGVPVWYFDHDVDVAPRFLERRQAVDYIEDRLLRGSTLTGADPIDQPSSSRRGGL